MFKNPIDVIPRSTLMEDECNSPVNREESRRRWIDCSSSGQIKSARQGENWIPQNARSRRINFVCMWDASRSFKVYFKITEELVKIKGQGKCITWSVDLRALDQIYNIIVKYIENR